MINMYYINLILQYYSRIISNKNTANASSPSNYQINN
jgi:hypothetical protein